MYISVRNNCKTSSGNQTSSNFYRNHTSLQQGVEDDVLLDFAGQAGPAPTHWWVCGQASAGARLHQYTHDECVWPWGLLPRFSPAQLSSASVHVWLKKNLHVHGI